MAFKLVKPEICEKIHLPCFLNFFLCVVDFVNLLTFRALFCADDSISCSIPTVSRVFTEPSLQDTILTSLFYPLQSFDRTPTCAIILHMISSFLIFIASLSFFAIKNPGQIARGLFGYIIQLKIRYHYDLLCNDSKGLFSCCVFFCCYCICFLDSLCSIFTRCCSAGMVMLNCSFAIRYCYIHSDRLAAEIRICITVCFF